MQRVNEKLTQNDENQCKWDSPSCKNVPGVSSTLSTANAPKINSLDFWEYTIELECLQGPQDLQLAAELGKTLLERNKELETTLKHHQNVIDDQAQKIEYLQKQTAALREVNDSRLRIYEQLEVGIQDLERANHRLVVENSNDKKQIKSLSHNIETLEARCEDLNRNLDEARRVLGVERRKNEQLQQEHSTHKEQTLRPSIQNGCDDIVEPNYETYQPNHSMENNSFFMTTSSSSRNANSTELTENCNDLFDSHNITNDENEGLIRLMSELEESKKALVSEQQRVAELEDQLVAIIQENQTLQSRIVQTTINEEMKSIHDELSTLDEVRQGTMCSRCLRSTDDPTPGDEASSIAPTEEDDDQSFLDLVDNSNANQIYRSAVTIKMSKPNSLDLNHPPSPNPYRDLVEKYEALLEVQTHSKMRTRKQAPFLGEEMQISGEYSSVSNPKEEDGDTFTGQEKNPNITLINANNSNGNFNGNASCDIENSTQQRKNCRRTPTEFSEAETFSSGFSDETSNKGTQTDERQGSFLCSIGDGEDCKFSIYDDASPIGSRFRNRPEYRELFKEIFAVLKKAAENKEEGDKLPLLDDTHPTTSKVPPVTPANEDIPDIGDDTQSIISSVISEQSVAMSECITKTERKTAKKHISEKGQENKPPNPVIPGPSGISPNGKQLTENGRLLTPLKREPLEYISVGVGIKKKNRKKNRNINFDRSDSPILPSPPRVYYSGKKRRDLRPFSTPSPAQVTPPKASAAITDWNGSSIIIYHRNARHPSASSVSSNSSTSKSRELDLSGVEFKPSPASQDLHKLKNLELSYAEVLRRADACKHHHRKK